MPYNSETSQYERRSTTVIDATPDGDTVAVAIDVKLDQGIDDYVTDLNHHAANGRHYPATSVADDSRYLDQSPAGVVSWKVGVPAANAALKDFSNVASGAIAPEKLAWANFPRRRNLIINGDFRINQRSYVSGTNTTWANQYTLDRWRVVTSGQNITFTDYLNGRQVTAPAGGIEQVIEDLNVAGGTYVLNWDGTAVGSVNGTVVAKGKPFTLPAKTHATVRLTGGTVARVQLEKGEVVTPFEERFIGDELALCQRYFQYQTPDIRFYAVGASEIQVSHVSFQVTMRITPTVTYMSNIVTLNVLSASITPLAVHGARFTVVANSTGDCYRRDVYNFDSEL